MKTDNKGETDNESINDRLRTVEFKASGTHCHSCSDIIKRQALKVDGVRKVEFDFKTEKGRVVFDRNKTDIKEIFKSIDDKGYRCSAIGNKGETSEYITINKGAIGWVAVMLALVVIGFFVFRLVEGINIPDISQNMSYSLLFVVGLLTGFHCVAMCGGFVVSYTAKASQEGKKTYKSHLMYGLGKVASYTIIGAIFGLLGSIIAFTPQLRGTLAILAGIFLLVFGLKMLGVFSFMRRFGFAQPVFISKYVAKMQDKGPLVIGLLNGLMIACGPLQAMYVLAAGTGSLIEGAKMLFVFGLGTLPVMLGFGYITSLISSRATRNILRFSGVVVIILGLIMLNNGLVLSGSGYDFRSIVSGTTSTINAGNSGSGNNGQAAVPAGNVAVLKEGYQEIRMTVDANGYTPDTFILKKGVPVKWIINAKQLTGCNKGIQVPAYGLKFDMKPGEQTIEFTPTESGTVRWSCWMGMIPGTFIVKDSLDSTVVANATQEVKAAAVARPSGGGCGCGGGGSASTCGG